MLNFNQIAWMYISCQVLRGYASECSVFIHFARNFEFGCPSMWHVSRRWFGSRFQFIIKLFINCAIMMLRDIFYAWMKVWLAPARIAPVHQFQKGIFVTRPLLRPIVDSYNRINLFKAKSSCSTHILPANRMCDCLRENQVVPQN